VSFTRYIAVRLALVVPVLVGILVLTFLLTHVLPNNPAVKAAGPYPTDEAIAKAEQDLGLDQPLPQQLGNYLWDLVRGDLGTSFFTKKSAAGDLLDRLPSTLELITLSIFLAAIFGVGLAVLSADRDGAIRDYAARLFGTLGTSVPEYFLGLLLIIVFYSTLDWLPAPLGQAGSNAPEVPRWSGAYLLDAIAAGNGAAVVRGITHLILPVAALSLVFAGPIYRVARAAIEEVRSAAYVDYVTMMGGSQRFVMRAVVANALPPILTITGIIYSHLLGGAVLIETIFGWGGVGQYAVEGIFNNDFYAIQAFVLFVAVFSVLVYLAVDLAHAVLDPRVRRAL
jgi:ABC-type dipeptide/oligopeptide/nickel transport system permease component